MFDCQEVCLLGRQGVRRILGRRSLDRLQPPATVCKKHVGHVAKGPQAVDGFGDPLRYSTVGSAADSSEGASAGSAAGSSGAGTPAGTFGSSCICIFLADNTSQYT